MRPSSLRRRTSPDGRWLFTPLTSTRGGRERANLAARPRTARSAARKAAGGRGLRRRRRCLDLSIGQLGSVMKQDEPKAPVITRGHGVRSASTWAETVREYGMALWRRPARPVAAEQEPPAAGPPAPVKGAEWTQVPAINLGPPVKVVGESFYQEALERVGGGRCSQGPRFRLITATLVREPHNRYDANAVRVDAGGLTRLSPSWVSVAGGRGEG